MHGGLIQAQDRERVRRCLNQDQAISFLLHKELRINSEGHGSPLDAKGCCSSSHLLLTQFFLLLVYLCMPCQPLPFKLLSLLPLTQPAGILKVNTGSSPAKHHNFITLLVSHFLWHNVPSKASGGPHQCPLLPLSYPVASFPPPTL